MKTTISNGKRYNSDKCETLAERDHRSNGNYSGTSYLMRASDGQLLILIEANGQDCWLQSGFEELQNDVTEFLIGVDLTDEQEARLAELGLITIVD